jgi:hypothetical protein
MGSDENNWNRIGVLGQAPLQLQAVHAWHPQIKDKAGCLLRSSRNQKLFRRCEGLRPQSG